jgi:drug/metabolite transporter (DMT)-like permease
VGVALLAWRAPAEVAGKSAQAGWAIAACLAASCCYGIAASYARRRLTGVPPIATATGSQLGAALALALPTLWFWPDKAPGWQAWAAVVAIALLCTAVAYILYFRLIAHAGPSRALAVTFITPLFAVLYGTLFLHEAVTLWMLGCAVIIVSGTLLSTGLVSRLWPRG